MTKYFFPITAALLAMVIGNCHADTVIPAEIPTAVELSNMDINRIVCPGPMTDLIFSQEKGMTGHFYGNNAFIKFKIEDMGGEYIYADEQSELFVVCNNTVYTLMLPRRISSPLPFVWHHQRETLSKKILPITKICPWRNRPCRSSGKPMMEHTHPVTG